MKGNQEVGCWSVYGCGCGTMKCNWCDGLAISLLLDISLMMGSCGAGHWKGRQMCTDKM